MNWPITRRGTLTACGSALDGFKHHWLAHFRYSLADSTIIGHRTPCTSQVRDAFADFSIPGCPNGLALRVVGYAWRFQPHLTIEHACASRHPTRRPNFKVIDHPTDNASARFNKRRLRGSSRGTGLKIPRPPRYHSQ